MKSITLTPMTVNTTNVGQSGNCLIIGAWISQGGVNPNKFL
jgi:hypothetical protein